MNHLPSLHHVPVLFLLAHATMSQFQPQGGFSYPGAQPLSMQFQMPGSMPGAMQMQMPGGMQMPSGMQMPGGIQMPAGIQMPLTMSSSKLPVIMMPYHSKSVDEKRKKTISRKRKPKKQASRNRYDSDSEIYDDDDDFNDDTRRSHYHGPKKLREQNRRQVLTPVVSYVTKDGYVVYQKKIAKTKPSEWLDVGKKEPKQESQEDDMAASLASEELFHRMNNDRYNRRHGHR